VSRPPRALALAAGIAGALGCARDHGAGAPGPVASTVFAVAAELGSTPEEIERAWAQVEEIRSRVAARHARTRGDWIDDLDAVVFAELGYEREIDSQDVRFFRLPSVIAARRGTCLGLGALYLVLGERLGVGLDGVMVPGHFFVRTRDGAGPRNVELLRRGEVMPDAWYQAKYGPWPAGGQAPVAPPYFRALRATELAGVFWFNAGNHLRAARDLRGAAAAYARAASELPGFAEAEASLGAVRQLQGALDEAEAAYAAAARDRPGLPGLDQNLALLKRERTVQPINPRRHAP
jgi:tetratricopeptide (TPR) repeat protein